MVLEDSILPTDVTRYVSGVEGDLAVSTSLTGSRVLNLVDLHGDVMGHDPDHRRRGRMHSGRERSPAGG